MTTLKFKSWKRSGIFELAASKVGGRLRGHIEIGIENRNNAADAVSQNVRFQIMGPADVKSLAPLAIGRVAPAPLSQGEETTFAPHVEFVAPDLPWRFTPEKPGGANDELLRPWLVLLVGDVDEITIGSDARIFVKPEVLQDYDLTKSARWVHYDETGGRNVSRLVSMRPMQPNREYIAALVPAFQPDGSDAWPAIPNEPLALPDYFHWKFTTGERGDFASLAADLNPEQPSPSLGQTVLTYDRIDPPVELIMQGALAPIGGSESTLIDEVRANVEQLQTPLQDPRGRPVVTLPTYGLFWINNPKETTWGDSLNNDPRYRIAGGLGLRAGIELQEAIALSARSQVGAIEIAAQRIRSLVAGLSASRALWKKRLPSNAFHRLLILGVSARRIVSPEGVLHARLNVTNRPMPASIFSSAARRIFRPGPARTKLAAPNAASAEQILQAANTCPPRPLAAPTGTPNIDPSGEIGERIRTSVKQQKLDPIPLLQALNSLPLTGISPAIQNAIKSFIDRLGQIASQGNGFPFIATTEFLVALSKPQTPTDLEIRRMIADFDDSPDDDDVLDLGDTVATEPPKRDCVPIDLPILEETLSDSIDPTGDRPSVVDQVLETITGLDETPLAEPRICPNVELPLWRFFRDHAPDWLLPGIGELNENTVTAVTTNPEFINAFFVGANTQANSELIWRNFSMFSGCTPLRVFWDRLSPTTGQLQNDIRPIAEWNDDSGLGAATSQASETSRDLVLVIRGTLFNRYPETLVYLTPAEINADGEPDWESDPAFMDLIYPVFQGRVGVDVVFFGFDQQPGEALNHWLVLEEPPPGFRFRNSPPAGDLWNAERIQRFENAESGATFADAAFNEPTRVIIPGNKILPQVTT